MMGVIVQDTDERKTILIVDDIVDNIQVLRSILASRYRTRIATSGDKALALADCQEPPDLILLDVMMPGIDGYEVCRELKRRANTRNVPVIFVTALEDASDEERGFDAGAVDYITKPVVPAIVLARVATHLALQQALKDLEKQNCVLSENVRLREQVERITRHDLKTPLTAFIGIPALLKNRADLPADVIDSVRMLEKSGMKMLDMINRSMDLYKIESGTYRFRPVPVELVKTVSQIEFELSGLINAKSIKLMTYVDGEEASADSRFYLDGDETLCYSMLANIIKNSVEASPDHGLVKVSFCERPQLRITLNNAGVIPLEIRDKFLQKFVSHGKMGGTGLGGYSARIMAEAMGGTMSFTSDDITGTTIVIDFAKDARVKTGERDFSHLRTLIVESNQMLLFTISETLRSIGLHRIEALVDCEALFPYLGSKPSAQLIIIDWQPAVGSCRNLIEKIHASNDWRQVPLLIIAPESMSEECSHLDESDAVLFVSKPFSPDILVKKVEGTIERMLQLASGGDADDSARA
ncbi:MAG: response regulator [Candidatus Riflebacteria bacterium]|nr:response regulator [Candidatus Riflebacteria bacterium]